MTNFEKYKDDLMKIEIGDFAFNKVKRRVIECGADIDCEDCIFNGNCFESVKIKWLYKKYESSVLSDDEIELIKAIGKATNKEYKYLVRQKGKIYLFTNKPFVHRGAFGNSYTSNNYFACISDKDETLFKNIENEMGIYDIENKIFI